jgi:hypothetical protein
MVLIAALWMVVMVNVLMVGMLIVRMINMGIVGVIPVVMMIVMHRQASAHSHECSQRNRRRQGCLE